MGQEREKERMEVPNGSDAASPRRRAQDELDRLDKLRKMKVEAARKTLLRFLMEFELRAAYHTAGVAQPKDWIQSWPEKFVKEIEYVEAMEGIG